MVIVGGGQRGCIAKDSDYLCKEVAAVGACSSGVTMSTTFPVFPGAPSCIHHRLMTRRVTTFAMSTKDVPFTCSISVARLTSPFASALYNQSMLPNLHRRG